MTPEQIIQYFPSLIVDDIFAVCAYASELIDELAQLRAANAELQAEIKELHECLSAENSEVINCHKNIAELVTQRSELEKDITDLLSKIGLLEWKLTRENRAGDDMARKLDGLVSERDAANRAAYVAEAAADERRDEATVRGDTYRRRALALARLCRRLENGERILGTGFAVGAARKFVADEMTARCADCGQMIMLTVQEYIKRRKDSPK